MVDNRRLITRKELMALTKKARGERKQVEVANNFGVSQAAVSQAENKEDASLDELRKKIIARYLNIGVKGPAPYFELTE